MHEQTVVSSGALESAAPNQKQRAGRVAAGVLSVALALAGPGQAVAAGNMDQGILPDPVAIVSTVPPNGDVNPYGVAFVPPGFPTGGTTSPGDILVSNFNNSANLQGTGTTIVRIPKTGPTTVFFQGASGLGLTTALNVLEAGLVIVGNLPTADGSCATATAG